MRQTKTSLGYTLTELLVAVTLTSVLASGVYTFLRGQSQSATSQMQSSRGLREAQRVRGQLTNDLTRAGFDPRRYDSDPPGRDPFTPITTAANDRVTVQGDFDMNGAIDTVSSGQQEPETIDYLYDAGTQRLTRNGSPVLQNLNNLTFAYYNSSNALLSDPVTLTQIRKVRIQWTITTGKTQTTYEDTVIIKNQR